MNALTIPSPVGPLQVRTSDNGLRAVLFDAPATESKPDALCVEVARQLAAYFAGRLRAFELPLDLVGTEFQKQVWTALCGIPFGETSSYGVLAKRLGSPGAARAVGLANGQNPVAIVVPCHRVIGSGGSLVGYGGGLDRKRWLLNHEGVGRQTSMFA